MFIRSAHGEYFLDHNIANRLLLLGDHRHDPATGAYDGTLWRIEEAGGGRVFVRSAHGEYFLDHNIANRLLLLGDHRHDQATGAYDGTLWRVVDAGGGRVLIRSAHGEYFLDHNIANRLLLLGDHRHDPATGAYDGTLWHIVGVGSSGLSGSGTRFAVDNRSSHTVFVKPEGTNQAVPVRSGSGYEGRHDGISAPHLRRGQVFKTSDYVGATVTNNSIETHVPFFRLFSTFQAITGGVWLQSSPDDGWAAVFGTATPTSDQQGSGQEPGFHGEGGGSEPWDPDPWDGPVADDPTPGTTIDDLGPAPGGDNGNKSAKPASSNQAARHMAQLKALAAKVEELRGWQRRILWAVGAVLITQAVLVAVSLLR